MIESEQNAVLMAAAIIFSVQARPDHRKAVRDGTKLQEIIIESTMEELGQPWVRKGQKDAKLEEAKPHE